MNGRKKIHASGEDYLEAVLILQKEKSVVRFVDLARHMGFSKPSISHAVGVLKGGGFLTVDGEGCLHLTDAGKEVAEKIYEWQSLPQILLLWEIHLLAVQRQVKSPDGMRRTVLP
ncbi:MAG: hypothetical protein K1W38_09615 [Lachnospiraceae bacterium]